MGGLIPLTGISVLPFGCEPIYPICLRSRSFLHWFQGQRPGRAPHGLCRDQKAMICPISKRFLGHFFVNPSSVLIGFAFLPRLSGWQRQSLHPPQHASEQAPRQMALRQQQPVVPRMLYQPPAGLHQPLLQARQGPLLDSLRQHQPPPQVAQVVCDHAQPQPHLVRPELIAPGI